MNTNAFLLIRRFGNLATLRLLRCTANAQHLVFLASIFGCGPRPRCARNDMRRPFMSLRVAAPLRGWCQEENGLNYTFLCNVWWLQDLWSFLPYQPKPIFLGGALRRSNLNPRVGRLLRCARNDILQTSHFKGLHPYQISGQIAMLRFRRTISPIAFGSASPPLAFSIGRRPRVGRRGSGRSKLWSG